MELVVGTYILTRGLSYLIECSLGRSTRCTNGTSEPHRRQIGAPVPPTNATQPSPSLGVESLSDQSEVTVLEKRLVELRAAARSVNSADTFVQYARLTREANAVENQIAALKSRC